jgi:hypothetical protein
MVGTQGGGAWWITAIAAVVAIHVSCGGSGGGRRVMNTPAEAPPPAPAGPRSPLEGEWTLVGLEAAGSARKVTGFLRYDRFANIAVHAELAADEPSARPPRTVVAAFTAKASLADGELGYTGLRTAVGTERLTEDATRMDAWRVYAVSGDTLRLSVPGGAATLIFQRSN